jgi:23S rRNA pseudouridine1911/1915/1917 synthase
MRKFRIKKEYKGYTVSEYLKEVEEYSGRSIRNLKCFLNGKPVKSSKRVRPHNTLLVKEVEKGTDIKPIKIDLNIVYEDDDLLILDKEPYIVVHPTLKKTDKTLAHGIVYYFKETMGKIIVPRFYNRLDMDTSGLIVIAKNSFSQAYLQEKVDVRKWYQALVHGIVEQDEFYIEKPIGRVGDSLRRVILPVEEGGQTAKSKVKVMERFPDKNMTLIQVELFTGRTHQIRVHLESMGHPLLGDKLYQDTDDGVKRQMLHAYKLKIKNPSSKLEQIIKIDLPEDMKGILNK